MGYQSNIFALKDVTSGGDVGDAGKPVLIYGYGIESGASAAAVYFNKGTTGSQTKGFLAGPLTANQGNVNIWGNGIMFPNGCFVSVDGNTVGVTAFYQQQSTTVP